MVSSTGPVATPTIDGLGGSHKREVCREFPGAMLALDDAYVIPRLLTALSAEGMSVDSVSPGNVTYLPGRSFSLRYSVTVRDREGEKSKAIVNAYLFKSAIDADHYARTLKELSHRLESNPSPAPFPRTYGILEGLHMAVAAWPVDGELPSLVDASNPAVLLPILGRATDRELRSCVVRLGHYGRRHRCVLRYEIEAADEVGSDVVYGKVAADERGAIADAALAALHNPAMQTSYRVPWSLGYIRELKLLLLEAIDGRPAIGAILKGAASPGSLPSLEDAIYTSARLLCWLHSVDFNVSTTRDWEEEVGRLGQEVAALKVESRLVGEDLEAGLSHVRAGLSSTDRLPSRLAHGDFRHTQIIFDGDLAGLVDFDTVCRAEPALDIGHFLAYLRLAVAKTETDPSVAGEIADRLADAFLSAYAEGREQRESALRARVAPYEVLSLVRLGVHSWQKLKTARLVRVLSLLKERAPC